jgi:hypothetical protein
MPGSIKVKKRKLVVIRINMVPPLNLRDLTELNYRKLVSHQYNFLTKTQDASGFWEKV